MFLSKGEVDNSGNPIDDDYLAQRKAVADAIKRSDKLAGGGNSTTREENILGFLLLLGIGFVIFFIILAVDIMYNFPDYLNSFQSIVNSNEDILIISSVTLIVLLLLGSIFYFAGSVLAIIIVFLIPFFLFIFISGISDLEKIQYILVIGIIVISGLLYKILDKLK